MNRAKVQQYKDFSSRLIISGASLCVLAKVAYTSTAPDFFPPLMIYALTLVLEYWKSFNQELKHLWAWGICMFLAVLWLFIGFTGLWGMFVVRPEGNCLYLEVGTPYRDLFGPCAIHMRYVFVGLLINLIGTGYSWTARESKLEKIIEEAVYREMADETGKPRTKTDLDT